MENIPLVSVVIPCYNQAQYLSEAIDSVFNQTYTNWECIIVNDGSTDNTAEVANEWVAKDNRFIYLFQKNEGLSSARNKGLDKARGGYFQFLDSDDYLDKRKLEVSLRSLDLEINRDKKIAISNFRMFSVNPNITTIPYCNLNEPLFNFESLLYAWGESFTIPIHCGFFEASLFNKIRFQESLKAKEDWVMWVSIFYKEKCKATFIDEPLALYRRNPNSMTMTKNMLLDSLEAYEYFKTMLNEEEFHRLSLVLISRYFKSNEEFKNRLRSVKSSNTYQTGLMIKKVLKKLGILKPFRYLFLIILKFKSK